MKNNKQLHINRKPITISSYNEEEWEAYLEIGFHLQLIHYNIWIVKVVHCNNVIMPNSKSECLDNLCKKGVYKIYEFKSI